MKLAGVALLYSHNTAVVDVVGLVVFTISSPVLVS